MTQNRQIDPASGQDDHPGLEHGCRPLSEHEFGPLSEHELVGRTSASASGRALVPTILPPTGDGRALGQAPPAAFLAQLIATALKAPQTRARRRAEPGDASAVYTSASAACAHLGAALYRSM